MNQKTSERRSSNEEKQQTSVEIEMNDINGSAKNVVPSWLKLRFRQEFLYEMEIYKSVVRMTRIVAMDGSEIACIFTGTVHIKDFLDFNRSLPVFLPYYTMGEVVAKYQVNHGNDKCYGNELLDILYEVAGMQRFRLLTTCSDRYDVKKYIETRNKILNYVMTSPESQSDYNYVGVNDFRKRRVLLRDEIEVMNGDLNEVYNVLTACMDLYDAPLKKKRKLN